MRGKLLIIVVVVLSLAIVVPTALAALGDNQKQELKGLYLQMLDVQKQIIQKKVQFGLLTREQGDELVRRLEENQKYLVNESQAGDGSAQDQAAPPGSYGCGGPDQNAAGLARDA